MADQFPEISKGIKREIEETLGKARAEQLSFEMLEIYNKVIVTLENSGIKYLRTQKLFPFKDTVIAWDRVLKESKVEGNPDTLLGIILATIYERTKEKQ